MKKRILSMVLAILMIVTLIPAYAVSDTRQPKEERPVDVTRRSEAKVPAESGEADARASTPKTAARAASSDIKYEVEGGYIYFNKSTGAITDCDKTVTKAVIPSQINGVSVTSIGYEAFAYCNSLMSVEIPNGVTSIGNRAFNVCTSLESINVADSNTVFSSENGVLFSKNETNLIRYPEGKTEASYVIPNSVTYIGSSAFQCSPSASLTSVTIPNSVTSIGDYAFSNCGSLSSIEIPNSVTSIGDYAFSSCGSLSSIEIPNSVTSIGKSAFNNCTSFTSITIPNNVTSIGYAAFNECKSLVSITIENGVTSIGDWAFEGCESLISVAVPSSVKSIGFKAFAYCTGLNNVIISSGVTEIGKYAFSNCTNLKSITIPDSVTSIGEYTFESCTSLESAEINSMAGIGGYAFQKCSSLKKITLSNSIKSIGNYAFYRCTNLKSITIPDSVTSIGEHAFEGCTGLESAEINGGAVIGNYAFQNCSSLNKIILSNSIKSIGNYAFYYCKSLEQIKIPASVTSIGDRALNTCLSLTAITVDKSNTAYTSTDGVLFNKDKTVLIQYPVGKTTEKYSIPDGVTDIKDGAFTSCPYLQSVTIPGSVNEVLAFGSCTNLKNVIINRGVTSIGNSAFYNCTSLTSITIPNNVTSIGNSAFYNCTSLTSIKLPNSLTSIGGGAFCNCKSLTSITIPNNVTSIGGRAFSECRGLSSVILPYKLTKLGDSAFTYCYKLTSITFSDQITYIGLDVFHESGLKDVYYSGSKEQWGKIDIETYYWYHNETLLNATFHFNYNNASYTSIYDSDTNTLYLTTYGNKNDSGKIKTKYTVLSGVSVSGGKADVETDEDGSCKVEKAGEKLTFSKKGYVSRTIPLEALQISRDVYLQKESEYPVISAVWMDDVYDIMNTEKALTLVQKDSHKVNAEIDWGSSSAKNIVIYQGERSIDISSGASFVWSDKFDISKDIYVAATNSDGLTTEKKLEIASGSNAAQIMDGAKIGFGDSLSFALPNSIPGVGGQKLSIGLYDEIPIKAVVEDGKWYIAIGYQGDVDKGEVKSFVESSKELRNSLKTAKTQAQKYKKVAAAAKKQGKKLAKVDGSWGVDTGFSVMGFAEGWYGDDGSMHFQDGGMVLTGNLGVSGSIDFFLGQIPCYGEFEFEAELISQLNLIMGEAAKKFTPSGVIGGELALSLGAGVGISKAFTIGGGVTGKINIAMNYQGEMENVTSAEARASINGYFKVTALCLKYKHEFDPLVDKLIFQYPDPAKNVTQAAFGVSAIYERVYNAENYGLPDLSYLKGGSRFTANGSGAKHAPSLTSLDTSNIVTSNFLGNSYEQAKPQLLALGDGTKLAVWLGYNSDSSSINAISLYYSYYDGSQWSNPLPVEADGTMDWDFDLKNIGGNAYVLWQDADCTVAENATLDDVTKIIGISAAVFDAESRTFTTYKITDGANGVNMLPVLCGVGDTVTAVWSVNTEYNAFANNSANNLCKSSFDGDMWSGIETVYSGVNSIDSLAAAYVDGELNIAYSAKTGSDVNNITDTEVYLNGSALTSDDVTDTGVVYKNGTLYWYKNGALMSNESEVVSAEHGISSDRYQLIDENGVKAILFTVNNGVKSGLYGVFYDETGGDWGKPTALTDSDNYIASFSATATQSGDLQILLNCTEVDDTVESGSPYGESAIQLITISPEPTLEITDVYYSGETYMAGEAVLMELTVANSGQTAVNGIVVKIYDGDKLIGEKTFNITVYGGSTETVNLNPRFDEVVQNRELTIKVCPSGNEDNCVSTTVALSQNDIAVENISWGMNDSENVLVYADIVNRGYTIPEGATISLRKGSASGEIISSVGMNKINTLGTQHVKFETLAHENDVFYITIELEAEDNNSANNEAYVVIRMNSGIECLHEYEKITTAATCTEDGSVVMTCSICGDSYIETILTALGHDYIDGVCTRCGSTEEIVSNGSCGDGLTWKLNSDGMLTISGSGEISGNPEWKEYVSQIKSVSIDEGVTAIGENAFVDCTNLTDVYYSGTAADWSRMAIASGNEPLANAELHFTGTIPGDLNGDGKVNVMDLIRLKRYLADGTEVVGNADVNGDGKVNVMDLIRLKRYIAGEAVDIY